MANPIFCPLPHKPNNLGSREEANRVANKTGMQAFHCICGGWHLSKQVSKRSLAKKEYRKKRNRKFQESRYA